MNALQIADIFDYAAAAIGIVMFLPQAVQCWKTKDTKAVSFATFSLLATTSVLWIVYGAIMKAIPILLVNITILIISFFILYLKRKYG
ncbi:MAG: SemiSWEET family transporter [Candidatus Parcubacteria bacterium]|nr:SemiSWEET family transporter [Candidatus Parcubacteria bacterium]